MGLRQRQRSEAVMMVPTRKGVKAQGSDMEVKTVCEGADEKEKRQGTAAVQDGSRPLNAGMPSEAFGVRQSPGALRRARRCFLEGSFSGARFGAAQGEDGAGEDTCGEEGEIHDGGGLLAVDQGRKIEIDHFAIVYAHEDQKEQDHHAKDNFNDLHAWVISSPAAM